MCHRGIRSPVPHELYALRPRGVPMATTPFATLFHEALRLRLWSKRLIAQSRDLMDAARAVHDESLIARSDSLDVRARRHRTVRGPGPSPPPALTSAAWPR